MDLFRTAELMEEQQQREEIDGLMEACGICDEHRRYLVPPLGTKLAAILRRIRWDHEEMEQIIEQKKLTHRDAYTILDYLIDYHRYDYPNPAWYSQTRHPYIRWLATFYDNGGCTTTAGARDTYALERVFGFDLDQCLQWEKLSFKERMQLNYEEWRAKSTYLHPVVETPVESTVFTGAMTSTSITGSAVFSVVNNGTGNMVVPPNWPHWQEVQLVGGQVHRVPAPEPIPRPPEVIRFPRAPDEL